MPEKLDEKPRTVFEQMIHDAALSGDTLKNALDFAAFLEANEMIVGQAHGNVSYKGECVCYVHVDGAEQKPGPWTIWTEGDYSAERKDVPLDEHGKAIAWANVNFCGNCGGNCAPGTSKTIFGKEFSNVCGADMAFNNPDAETLECAKKLLEMRKYALEDIAK